MAIDWQLFLFTGGIALLSTALIAPLGVALAWRLARRRSPFWNLVEAIAMSPLVLPPVAIGFLLLQIFGRGGTVVFTWMALVIACAVMSFPLLLRGARVGMESVDRSVEEAARVFGAGPWRVFFSVTLPLAGRGIAAGLVLAFARAVGEFGATLLVAGEMSRQTQTVSLRIYDAARIEQNATAWPLVAICLLIAFAAIWLSERLARRTAA